MPAWNIFSIVCFDKLAGPKVHIIFVFFNKTSPRILEQHAFQVKVNGEQLRLEPENLAMAVFRKDNDSFLK